MPRQFRNIILLMAFLGLVQGSAACDSTQATPQPIPGATSTPTQILSPQIEIVTEEPQIDTPVPIMEEESDLDPYVKVEVSEINLNLGETVAVTGWPVDINLPNYYLILRDEGVQDNPFTAMVTHDNQVTPGEGRSKVVEWVSAEGRVDQVIFVLRAIGEGVTAMDIEAIGELQLQDGSTLSVAGSGSVLIIVGD